MRKSKEPTTHFFKKAVEIPMYGGYFIIIFSDDIYKVAEVIHARPEEIGYLYGQTFHNFIYKGYESFCVCLNFWHKEAISLGTIIHEVNHAGNRIMDARGFDPDFENDEAECYLKGWCADEVQSFMLKCGIN